MFLSTGLGSDWAAVSHLVAYGRRRAEAAGKSVRCHLVFDKHETNVEGIAEFAAAGGYLRARQDYVRDEGDLAWLFDMLPLLRRAGVQRLGLNIGLKDYRGSAVDRHRRWRRGCLL